MENKNELNTDIMLQKKKKQPSFHLRFTAIIYFDK